MPVSPTRQRAQLQGLDPHEEAAPADKPKVAEADGAWGAQPAGGAWAASKSNAVAAQKRADLPSAHVAMIRQAAIRQAGETRTISPASKTWKRLETHYLAELLASDAPVGSSARKALGKAAVDKIGKVFEGPAKSWDYWESGALAHWNNQKVPDALKKLIPGVPSVLSAGTDVLSTVNRPHLSYLDVPHLLGRANEDFGEDADVKGGGKNISQLMHWATGVKYGPQTDKETMRELFLLYELWHLEGWDVFSEDALNDLIAEEQGGLFGRRLANGEVTKENLGAVIDETFAEARAWVGKLLKERQPQLDALIDAETIPDASMWYGKLGTLDAWGEPSFKEQLAAGSTEEQVRQSSFAKRITGVYALIYEAEAWDRANPGNPMTLSRMTESMVRGKYDDVMRKTTLGEPLSTSEMLGAVWNGGRNEPIGDR